MSEASEKPARTREFTGSISVAGAAAHRPTINISAPAVGARIIVARGLSLEYVGDTEEGDTVLEVVSGEREAEEAA